MEANYESYTKEIKKTLDEIEDWDKKTKYLNHLIIDLKDKENELYGEFTYDPESPLTQNQTNQYAGIISFCEYKLNYIRNNKDQLLSDLFNDPNRFCTKHKWFIPKTHITNWLIEQAYRGLNNNEINLYLNEQLISLDQLKLKLSYSKNEKFILESDISHIKEQLLFEIDKLYPNILHPVQPEFVPKPFPIMPEEKKVSKKSNTISWKKDPILLAYLVGELKAKGCIDGDFWKVMEKTFGINNLGQRYLRLTSKLQKSAQKPTKDAEIVDNIVKIIKEVNKELDK